LLLCVIPHFGSAATQFWTATTIASLIVVVELFLIAWIRNRYMDSPFATSIFQVVVGGVLVFLTGVLIGIS
jgi:hypothetical protein